nr:hypothetical protein MtrDRAFT_AC155890g42v2 [Medicago truncatula]
MSTHAGHSANVGFTEVDVRNYITTKRQRSAPPSKHAQSSRVPPQRSSQVRELTTNMVNGVSCSAPPTYEPPLARENMFVSYTTMLMAPFDDTNIGALL